MKTQYDTHVMFVFVCQADQPREETLEIKKLRKVQEIGLIDRKIQGFSFKSSLLSDLIGQENKHHKIKKQKHKQKKTKGCGAELSGQVIMNHRPQSLESKIIDFYTK